MEKYEQRALSLGLRPLGVMVVLGIAQVFFSPPSPPLPQKKGGLGPLVHGCVRDSAG
jgi:hypothetical protein